MTIRFVTAWNGYHGQQVVSGLGRTEEARLISLGFAVSDIDGVGNATVNARKVILIGDSITEQNWGGITFNTTLGINQATLAEGYDTNMTGYAEVANSLLGAPYEFINAAKGGQTTTWMLSNLALVLSNNADASEVWYHGGINDISGGATDSTLYDNAMAAYTLTRSYNMRFVWSSTLMPTAAAAMTTTQRNYIAKANARLAQEFKDLPFVDVIDVSPVFVDYSNANGWTLESLMKDTLHPSNAGGWKWGKLASEVLAYRAPAHVGGVASPADAYAVDSTSTQFVIDPLNLGATSAAGGTGMSGTQLTALTIARATGSTSTAVASVVDAPNGKGKAQKLVVTSGELSSFSVVQAISELDAAMAGRTFQQSVLVRISNVTNFSNVMLQTLSNVTSGAVAQLLSYALSAGSSPDGITDTGTYVLRVTASPFTYPTDMTAITNLLHAVHFAFTGVGGGTIEVYGRECREIV